ncbi:uncharacterized protein LOC111541613 [Piliocolobus tephrosceles]|uniref:uncharacterized protein LOC111541613 n=1 Tax=Piliocolobus tephrosceles TaxID=591936 RepID=UPI000C2A7390|nr:uncharacterized protein LOC111541613 [Piliocolobus tephrosceles]
MNQPRPGARPPRFLFSFSTPLAAGAARLQRRSFPGTLPLTPLSALSAAWLLLNPLTKRFRIAKACPCHPPCPSPRALPRGPRHLALPSPEQPGATLFEVQPRRRGASVCVCGAAVGLSVLGERRKTRRGAPAAGCPGSRPLRGLGGTGAQARTDAHLPRGNPVQPTEPLPSRLSRPQEPLRLQDQLLPAKFHKQDLIENGPWSTTTWEHILEKDS